MQKNKVGKFVLGAMLLSMVSSAIFAAGENSLIPCDTPKPIPQCDQSCIADIQKILDTNRATFNTPGMQLTIAFGKDQTPLTFCSGSADKDGKTPIGKNSLFEIGELSKNFTSAIVLQLEAEKSLKLTDRVGHWLGNQYPEWSDMTIDQLLHHTAGVYDYGNSQYFSKIVFEDPTKIWSLDGTGGLMPSIYGYQPKCSRSDQHSRFCPETPGDGWAQSSGDYIVLEKIIEKVSGRTYQENLYRHILQPLGFSKDDIFYDPNVNPENIENMSRGYMQTRDVTNFSPSFARGAAGLIGSTDGLLKWMRTLVYNQSYEPLFSEMKNFVCTFDYKCKAGQPMPPDYHSLTYGRALERWTLSGDYQEMLGHKGGTAGYEAEMYYLPKEDYFIAIAVNTSDFGRDILDKVSHDVYMRLFFQGSSSGK